MKVRKMPRALRRDLLRLMSEEYTFVTRPVIVRSDRATAGFSAKRVDALIHE